MPTNIENYIRFGNYGIYRPSKIENWSIYLVLS